jgi:hypothetical protein
VDPFAADVSTCALDIFAHAKNYYMPGIRTRKCSQRACESSNWIGKGFKSGSTVYIYLHAVLSDFS